LITTDPSFQKLLRWRYRRKNLKKTDKRYFIGEINAENYKKTQFISVIAV